MERNMTKKLSIRKNIKVDIKQALILRFQHGLPYQKIADQLECSKNAVWKALKPLEKLIRDPNLIEAYERQRVPILTGAEIQLLEQMVDPAALKGAKANQLAYAFSQINSARRLESGLSTGNLDVNLNIDKLYSEALKKTQKDEPQLREEAAKKIGQIELIKDAQVISD
jgi:predicted DNA-binding protein (UPF0251 family)